MYKNFCNIFKLVAICYVLLFASFSYAENTVSKTGATTSLMLRVHYEDMLVMQGLRKQVKEVLNKERFMGERMFGYLYLRDTENGGVSFTAFLPEQHQAIKNLIKKYFPRIVVHQRGDEFTLKFDKTQEMHSADRVIPEIMDILYRRLKGFGVEQPALSRIGLSHILVEIPGENEQYVEVFKQLVTRSAKLSFLLEDRDMSPQEALIRNPHPGSAIFYHHRSSQKIPYLLDARPVITDRDVKYVKTGHDGREPFVMATLHSSAAERLAKVTHRNIGRRMGILFEDRVYMAPTIMETIRSGQVKITNHFSPAEAAGFAVLLASGSYPVGVEVVDERIDEIEIDDATCCEKSMEQFMPEPENKKVEDHHSVKVIKEIVNETENLKETVTQPAQNTDLDIKEEKPVVEKVIEKPKKEEMPLVKKEEIQWEKPKEAEVVIEQELEEPIEEIKQEEITWEKPADVDDVINKTVENIIEEPKKDEFPIVKQEEIQWEEPAETEELIEHVSTAITEEPESITAIETPEPELEVLMNIEPLADDLPLDVIEKVKRDPDVIEELSRFEQYLRNAEDIKYKIENVTSTPRKRKIPKEILELKISEGL